MIRLENPNMRNWTRYWKGGVGLLVGAMAIASDARGQTLVDAGTDQPADASAPAPSTPPPPPSPPETSPAGDEEGSAIQLHSSRVASLEELARKLRVSCGPKAGADETKELLEKAVVRAIAVHRGIEALEARRKKLEQDAVLAPRDGRIIAALALVARDKKNLEEAAKREAQGKADAVAQDIATLSRSLCKEFCSGTGTADSPINLCAFSSRSLANAAAIADFASIEALAAHLRRRIDSIHLVLADKSVVSMADLFAAEPSLRARLPVGAVAEAASSVPRLGHTGLDVVAFSVGAVDVGLRALASVILDRARREALVWFVERLHEDVCGGEGFSEGPNAAAYSEIRTYWLPTTCRLAGKPLDFLQYGGGAELLSALRGAIATDVGAWPSAALGFGVASSFWVDAKGAGTLSSCDAGDPKNRSPVCLAARELRGAAAGFFVDVARGANAALRLSELAGTIDRLNVTKEGKTPSFHSPALQVAACAASIPLVFQQYGDLVRETRPGRNAETEALLLAALTTSPACFSLVGKGFSEVDCPGFSTSDAGERVCRHEDVAKPGDVDAAPILAIGGNGRIEKLSTILRWSSRVESPARALEGRWRGVVDAFDAYRAAATAKVSATTGAPTVNPPSISIGAGSDEKALGHAMRALGEYARETSRLAQQNQRLEQLAAAALLGRASLDLGTAFAKASATAADPTLFPGLCAGSACDAAAVELVFSGAAESLARIGEALDLMEALLAEDHGKVVARVIASMRVDSARLCSSAPKGEGACGVVERLARHGGLFAALAFEADPERVAAAFEAAATPVGGWRRKNVPGSFTVSLASFPGLTFGGELRAGSYAGRQESLRTPYFVAPTLTMPVGIDFARGYGNYNLGVFVSALDPAAYLQYDAEQDGRLPGAKLLTALAPGLWLRAGLFGSPFALSAYSVFRPGLRSFESGVGAPGAHALQIGLAASIDVTLFDLFTGPARTEE